MTRPRGAPSKIAASKSKSGASKSKSGVPKSTPNEGAAKKATIGLKARKKAVRVYLGLSAPVTVIPVAVVARRLRQSYSGRIKSECPKVVAEIIAYYIRTVGATAQQIASGSSRIRLTRDDVVAAMHKLAATGFARYVASLHSSKATTMIAQQTSGRPPSMFLKPQKK